MKKRFILILLVVLNSMVLLGQLWPAGAPPFARTINILTLVLDLIVFLSLFGKNNKFWQ